MPEPDVEQGGTKLSEDGATGTETSTQDGVEVGRGVDGDTITLGSLTDLTGVFAALGKDITNAQALYWKDHKVCDTYTVKTTVKDHGYDTQKGIQLYSSIHNDVLAIQQTIGSPINTGLLPQFEADHMVNIPAAWAQSLTESPEIAVVGATYEVEMINVLDYLLEEGKIRFRRVGTHRRVRFGDLEAYRGKAEEEGRHARAAPAG